MTGLTGLEEYPLGNTGTNSQEQITQIRFSSKIHWFQGCFNYEDDYQPIKILERLKSCFPDDVFKKSYEIHRGNIRYRHVFRSVRSIILAYNHPTPDSSGVGWVSIPGGAFDTWEWFVDNLVNLFDFLSDRNYMSNFRCTQMHIAVDDYCRILTAELGLNAVQDGNIARFKPENYHYHLSTWNSEEYGILKGDSITFGTPNSDRRVTIYDKFVESKGEINATRFEAKFSGTAAHATYEHLSTLLFSGEKGYGEGFFNDLISLAFGAIDFPDRSTGDKNIDRCERLKWWQDALDYAGSIRIPVARKKAIIEASIEWLSRQTETTFAILCEVFGKQSTTELFSAMVMSGYGRLTESHRSLIQVSKNNPFDLIKYYNLLTKNEA